MRVEDGVMANDSRAVHNDYSDPRWQKLRLQVMDRDGWKCVACGDATSTLHVHHKRYCGSIWESPADDLQTLCNSCHAGLGPHPKAGVWYQRIGDIKKGDCRSKTWSQGDAIEPSTVVLAIQGCPSCASHEFVCRQHDLGCWHCGWSMELRPHLFLHAPAALVDEEQQKRAAEAHEKAKAQKHAIGQLRSWAKKCRAVGFSDADVWDAAFPEQAVPLGYRIDLGGILASTEIADEDVQKLRAWLTSGLSFRDVVFEIAGLTPKGRKALASSGY